MIEERRNGSKDCFLEVRLGASHKVLVEIYKERLTRSDLNKLLPNTDNTHKTQPKKWLNDKVRISQRFLNLDIKF